MARSKHILPFLLEGAVQEIDAATATESWNQLTSFVNIANTVACAFTVGSPLQKVPGALLSIIKENSDGADVTITLTDELDDEFETVVLGQMDNSVLFMWNGEKWQVLAQSIEGEATFTGGTISGASTFQSTLTVEGAASFTSSTATTFDNGIDSDGDVANTFEGHLDVNGTAASDFAGGGLNVSGGSLSVATGVNFVVKNTDAQLQGGTVDIQDGDTVTQTTSRSDQVTLNTYSGKITTDTASLGAGSKVTFRVNNTNVTTESVVVICYANQPTALVRPFVSNVGAGVFDITYVNDTALATTEAYEFNFIVFEGSHS